MMDTEDGQFFIKNLAQFVRTHEKALANALQLRRQQTTRHGSSQSVSGAIGASPMSPLTPTNQGATSPTTASTIAAALSLPYLTFASQNIKPAKLALTPHHLFYMLSRFEELGIPVGPMNVRLENLHSDTSTSNYVSFLSQSQRSKTQTSDTGSIHSVSSVRSVMSGMSSLWSNLGLGTAAAAARTEKQKVALEADLKYLYSAFTKIPCLRLSPDRRARLITGYEEFPFDTAVPLLAFKNLGALEISDLDFRQFYGWDKLADQLRSLSVRRAAMDDLEDLIVNIVLDDMDKRRRRSSKPQISPTTTWPTATSPKRSPSLPGAEPVKSTSVPISPDDGSEQAEEEHGIKIGSSPRSSGAIRVEGRARPRSSSPRRPGSARGSFAHGNLRGSQKVKRSGSGSSTSSLSDGWHLTRNSSFNMLAMGTLPASKWRFLKHLSIADNSLTGLTSSALAPLADTLHSLDISSNLFSQIPDCLATLTAMRALNLAHCMIDSLHSLLRNPLPAISALNLRGNRLSSLAGIERLYSLERLDLRDNQLSDPTELARLTGLPEIREVWVTGNPFVKTHSNYRVTIFNLFRRTPGYLEDILIDGFSPGYTERRQLIDRVSERMSVPVVKGPAIADELATNVKSSRSAAKDYPVIKEPVSRRDTLAEPTTSHDASTGRRRKTTKRRIVDLSTSDVSPTKTSGRLPSPEYSLESGTPKTSASKSSPSAGVDVDTTSALPRTMQHNPTYPRLDTSVVPQLPPLEGLHVNSPLIKHLPLEKGAEWHLSGDIYRQKMEALQRDAGNTWLSVLSEENWDHAHGADSSYTTAANLRPTMAAHTTSQPMLAGQTLG